MHSLRKKRIGLWVLLLLAVWLPCLASEPEAENILRRVEEHFRKAEGVEATFSVRLPQGETTGTIRLKGNKFVLEAGGVTTWFDGRTQWSLLDAGNEVNVSEPTAEELQTLHPYAWLSLYRQGYEARMHRGKNTVNGTCEVELTASPTTAAAMEKITVWIDRATWRPVRIGLTPAGGGETTLIVVDSCREGQAYPDRMFAFDPKEHPGVEVIDLR